MSAGRPWRDSGCAASKALDDYVLEIDYPGRTVRFYDPKKFHVPRGQGADERVIQFRRNGTRILTDLEVEGQTLSMLLDTGAPAVLIAGKAAAQVGIDWKDLPAIEGVGGVLGPIRVQTYVADQVRFAGFDFPDQPIAIAPRGAYNQGGPNDSALGYDILSRFVMRIDYGERRIWLKDSGGAAKTYWGRALERVPAVSAEPGVSEAPSESP